MSEDELIIDRSCPICGSTNTRVHQHRKLKYEGEELVPDGLIMLELECYICGYEKEDLI